MAYELAFGKVGTLRLSYLTPPVKCSYHLQRPYRAKTNEALTQAILSDSLEFPANAHDLVSADCIDCIKQVPWRQTSICSHSAPKHVGSLSYYVGT